MNIQERLFLLSSLLLLFFFFFFFFFLPAVALFVDKICKHAVRGKERRENKKNSGSLFLPRRLITFFLRMHLYGGAAAGVFIAEENEFTHSPDCHRRMPGICFQSGFFFFTRTPHLYLLSCSLSLSPFLSFHLLQQQARNKKRRSFITPPPPPLLLRRPGSSSAGSFLTCLRLRPLVACRHL